VHEPTHGPQHAGGERRGARAERDLEVSAAWKHGTAAAAAAAFAASRKTRS
jgi:hypothetical protein